MQNLFSDLNSSLPYEYGNGWVSLSTCATGEFWGKKRLSGGSILGLFTASVRQQFRQAAALVAPAETPHRRADAAEMAGHFLHPCPIRQRQYQLGALALIVWQGQVVSDPLQHHAFRGRDGQFLGFAAAHRSP